MPRTAPSVAGTDARRYAYEVEARARTEASLSRATRPFAALGALLSHDLDLVELTLRAALSDGDANRAAFSYWVARALDSVGALVLGRPTGQVDRILTRSGAAQPFRTRLRWTEPAVAQPLFAGRWRQALAVACIARDDALARQLCSDAWLALLTRHPYEAKVPSRHRRLLVELLAALVRGDAPPRLGPVRKALADDVAAPRPGPDGFALAPAELRMRVEPLLGAIELLVAEPLEAAAVRRALAVLAEIERGAADPARADLFVLARVAELHGVDAPLPSWVPSIDPAQLPAPPQVEDAPPIPPFGTGDGALDAVQLARVAEAFSTAATQDEWAAAWSRAPPRLRKAILGSDVVLHLFANGAWVPRTPVQAAALIREITGGQSLAELMRLSFEPVDPSLVVRGLAALDERDLDRQNLVAVVEPVARALALARPLLLAAELAPSIERLLCLLRAVAGDTLDTRQSALVTEALAALLQGPATSTNVIVESNGAGTVRPVGQDRIVAALERVAGRAWHSRVPASVAERLLPSSAARPDLGAARPDLGALLDALVSAARTGRQATIDHQIPDLGAHGPALLPHLSPRYDHLLDELRAGGGEGAARAAIALCRAAAYALRTSTGRVDERDARYLLREPLVWSALAERDRSAARLRLLEAIPLLNLEAPGRVAASWIDRPPDEPEPAPAPAEPPRRRRIVR